MGDYHTPSQWVQCEKRSDVWKHFLIDKNNKKRVKCKKCPMILEYVSSTTNMWRHMERAHPYLMDDASKSLKKPPDVTPIYGGIHNVPTIHEAIRHTFILSNCLSQDVH